MTPTVRTEDLADAQELATLLGLRHSNSVSTYQRRYPEMPRPIVDLGPGRPKLWLGPTSGPGPQADPPVKAPLKSNDPCWCGSGRKYKRCHQARQTASFPAWSHRPPGATRNRAAGLRGVGSPLRVDEPLVKSPELIERMRVAGRVAAEVLPSPATPSHPASPPTSSTRICHARLQSRGAATRARSTTTASRNRSAPRSTRSSATASPTPDRSRRRHRQPRRDDLPRRRARRHQRHVRAWATSTPRQSGSSAPPRSADAGHRGRERRAGRSRDRPGDRAPRRKPDSAWSAPSAVTASARYSTTGSCSPPLLRPPAATVIEPGMTSPSSR